MIERRDRGHLRVLLFFAAGLAWGCTQDADVLREGSTEDATEDPCAGLERDECDMAEGCAGIWGTPYMQTANGGWCLFGNGVQYLGCSGATDCAQTSMTICPEGGDTPPLLVGLDCLPEDLEAAECEPPMADVSAC